MLSTVFSAFTTSSVVEKAGETVLRPGLDLNRNQFAHALCPVRESFDLTEMRDVRV